MLSMIKTFLGLDFYTSELDDFLMDFDKRHPQLSRSQRMELDKYKRVYERRDKPEEPSADKSFWAGF